MMCHIDGETYLQVNMIVVSNITDFIASIVRKVNALLHVQERSTSHVLLCHHNCIKCLMGAPANVDQWQTPNPTDKLTAKEAHNVMGCDVFFIKRIVMIRFECLLPDDLNHVVAHPCGNKRVESVLVKAVGIVEHREEPIENEIKVDCPMFVSHLLQIALLQFNAKVLHLSGEWHWVDALSISSNAHCPILLIHN
jgi:hypothetical protein